MNRLSRVGIAVALLAGVLWSGGGAQAVRLPSAVTVCVDASSGVASRVMSGGKCVGAAQFWSATKSAPLLCWNASSVKRLDRSRLVSVAPSSGCVTPLRSIRAGKVALLCADAKTGVLHWPVTGVCELGNEQTWVRSAATTTTTVAATTTTVAATTTTTVAATTTTVALTCAQGGSCTVGVDTGPGGGKVFYYSATAFTSTGSTCNTNCHYLEVAPSDQSTGIVWATSVIKCNNLVRNALDCQLNSIYYPYGTVSPADSRTAAPAIGQGMANTNLIYEVLTGDGAVSTSSYAAGIAWAYTNNSKTDWFLPSKDELNELCKYAKNTGQASGGGTVCAGAISASVRGFSTVNYWSSSESTDGSTASVQTFNAGTQNNYPKDNLSTYYVRPIRAF
jgi:hypothetical protein